MVHPFVTSIFEDSHGMLWVGTFGGLHKFDPQAEIFTRYLPDPDDPGAISDSAVHVIYQDEDGTAWLGTGGGLNHFDPDQGTFTAYRLADGLPNETIFGILPDGDNLWLSTSKGLSRFNRQTKSFQNFDYTDGLQSNQFNLFSYHRSQQGELFFGGPNGLNGFFPANITPNDHQPSVVLTGFQLFNQPVEVGSEILPQTIDQTDHISINYDQSVIGLKFAGLSYQLSEKNLYQYKLDGFDLDWSPPSEKREATYTNLDPGNYTFLAKAANNDGLWNETPVALNLTILPPWWQTLWFRLAAGLGIIVLVVGGFSWRTYSIRARNRYLETEVAKRTSDLAEANQALQAANTETAQALVEAQAANRAKSAFLAHMSHELRTPLNGILGYAQIFDWDENLTKTQRHGLAVIQRSGDHLLNLINDVLDLARIEADHVVVRSATFDLQVFINELVDMLKPRARKKGLYFLAELRWLDSDGQLQPGDELPFVQTDSKLLRQVLINLIGNAMKFTQTGGVTLRISIGGQEASTGGEDNLSSSLTFRFEVADTGPGISAEDQKQNFVPFKQIGDIDYHPGGTGLGLSISQNRVDLLGGQLQVESEPGQGSTFWFELELPVVLPATDLNAAPVARRIVGVDGPSPTVLVVDDNVDNRAVLQEMLRRTGCRVYTAEDGAAGLATAEKTNPACIITDLIMPDISGNALIRQLRRQEQFADTVIIASSASVFEADRAESIVAGGNAFMPKPVRLENLHALLAEHLHAQWQYEESTLEETGPEHIFEEEPELPSDFVDKIHEAASVGDVAILHKVLSELEQLPAKYHHAASRLNRLVSNFQLTEVVAWMEKIKTPE